MPLPSDLLNPVPGAKPSGENLRYAPVYDKIKEARREEEEVPQGDWEHARKKADYPLVIKLCVESLRNQSKDLQLAAWATEALLKMEGIAGLTQGLELIRGLLESFWDTLHPELEDGDAELRATPLEWVGSRSGQNLQHVPITRNGLDLFAYRESRAVGYEADAAGNDNKTKAREQAITDGKITAEQFDEGVSATPKSFYEERLAHADACVTVVESLDQLCEGRFGDYRPSFSNLRESLEEVRDALNEFLAKKRAAEPAQPTSVAEPGLVAVEAQPVVASAVVVAAQPAVVVQSVSKEPASVDEAIQRIGLVAHYLRQQQPGSPVAYLLLRALRWGEVRANVGDVDISLLEAPPTEVRKKLRKLFQESDWQQLLEATESAMAEPSGRGWLDLQRYLVRASEGLGYSPVSSAIISELKSLLSDYPALPVSVLNDETPAAGSETQAWLAELVAPKQPQPTIEEATALREKAPQPEPGVEQVSDAYDLAMQAVRRGRPQEAIAILEREAAQERSGRGRFQRKMQLAQICMGAGFEMIALPVLEALSTEIDQRGLEEWEDPDVIIHALGLLYKCLHKLKRSPEQKEQVYARICRLGPAQALELAKSA